MKKKVLSVILAAGMVMSMSMVTCAAETPVTATVQETYAAQKAVLLQNAREYYAKNFNVELYKKANPGLVAVLGDDDNAYLEHYLACGIAEGRRTGNGFDPVAYIINNFDFYMQNGLTEGNKYFNAAQFMRWHPEIAADLNNDPSACLLWYLQYGVINKVSSCANFDIVEFAEKYPDAEARSNVTPEQAVIANKVEEVNQKIKEMGYDYYVNFYVAGTDQVNENIVISGNTGSANSGSSVSGTENTGSGTESGGTVTEPGEGGSGVENGSESDNNNSILVDVKLPLEYKSLYTASFFQFAKVSEDTKTATLMMFGDAYVQDLDQMNDEQLNSYVKNLVNSVQIVQAHRLQYKIEDESLYGYHVESFGSYYGEIEVDENAISLTKKDDGYSVNLTADYEYWNEKFADNGDRIVTITKFEDGNRVETQQTYPADGGDMEETVISSKPYDYSKELFSLKGRSEDSEYEKDYMKVTESFLINTETNLGILIGPLEAANYTLELAEDGKATLVDFPENKIKVAEGTATISLFAADADDELLDSEENKDEIISDEVESEEIKDVTTANTEDEESQEIENKSDSTEESNVEEGSEDEEPQDVENKSDSTEESNVEAEDNEDESVDAE